VVRDIPFQAASSGALSARILLPEPSEEAFHSSFEIDQVA